MKKAANVLCIISAILTCLAVVFLIFTPQMLGEFSYLVGSGTSSFDIFSESVLANWPAAHQAFLNFGNYQSNVLVLIFAIALLLIVVLWIVHIVIMAVKKRWNATWVNVAFIVCGLVSLDFIYIFLVPGYLGGTGSIMDSVLAITDTMKKILALLPYVLAAIALVLVAIALFISYADMARNPGAKKRFSQVPEGFVNVGSVNPANSAVEAKDEKAPTATSVASKNDDEIRSILNSELGAETASKVSGEPIVEGSGCGKGATAINPGSYSGPAPTIVQYISYGPDGMRGPRKDEKPLTRDDIRSIVADEMKKQGATPVEEEVTPNDSDVLTSDDLRSIIREEIAGTHKDEKLDATSTNVDEKQNEVDVSEKESTNPTGEVMTSEDLRQIVAEEISKAGKGENKDATGATASDSEVLTSDDLRSIIREELGTATKDIEQKEKDDIATETAPVAKEVEEENSDVLTSDDLRSIVAEEIAKANGEKAPESPVPSAGEETEEAPKDEAITTDDLRSIIREELSSKDSKEKEDAESEDKPEDKPLTANDLRTLIQEALEEHDNPERRQLTEDEARDLIVEQIRSFYLGKEKDEEEASKEEAKPVEKPVANKAESAPVAPTATPASNSNEILSSDDLRAIIHDEIASIKPVTQPVAPSSGAGVSSEDIKKLLSDELAKFRAEQALASQKAADEAADAHKIEQARAEAEAEQTKAQSEEIKNIKSSALSPDDIRSIVAEELDKKLAEKSVVSEKVVEAPKKEEVKKEPVQEAKLVAPVSKKETEPAPKAVIAPLAPKAEPKKEEKPAPKAEAKPTPVAPKAEAKPAPVVAPVAVTENEDEGEEEAKAKIIRIPFANRMLKAEKELQSNYNELKAECLSYGLKSRLSNSGDTFRLHTKTYVKITIAGKGLKLYFALNPKDYASGPIPLHDASSKNIYKEIPGVFKVKSPLSLKRAKQLLADAVEKDNLEQGKIEPHNWAIELKDYKPQLGGKDDED